MLKRNPQKQFFFMLCLIVFKKTQCENSSLKELANYLCHWTTHMRYQGLCDSMCGANLTIYDKFVYNVDETPCKISCIALKVLVWVEYSYIKMCYDNKSYIKKSQDDKLILNIRFEWNLIHTN